MPRLSDRFQPSAPRYRLHRPSNQAVVTINGRDFYLGKWNTAASRQAYDRVVAEWLAGGRRLPAHDSEPLTVEELVAAFWQHAERHYRHADGTPTSEIHNLRQALRPLNRLYGNTPAERFGPLSLHAVRQEMIGLDWCRTSINRAVSRIKSVFKWATAMELISPSVHHGLTSVAGLRAGRSEAKESLPVKPVPQAFVNAVLPLLTPQVATMVQLQLLTAARPGEVIAMRGCDLDTTGKIWTYTPAIHKTAYRGHRRVIYLGPQAQEIIKPFLRFDTTAYLFRPRDAKETLWAKRRTARKTPMTPSQAKRKRQANAKRKPGEQYSLQSYGSAVRKACLKAGVPHWHPHQLRHTAATMLRKDHGLDVARAVLGHRSPAITEVYAELDHAKATEVLSKIG